MGKKEDKTTPKYQLDLVKNDKNSVSSSLGISKERMDQMVEAIKLLRDEEDSTITGALNEAMKNAVNLNEVVFYAYVLGQLNGAAASLNKLTRDMLSGILNGSHED